MIPAVAMKVSRTPKIGQSKLGRMKQRLQYKANVTEGEHTEPPGNEDNGDDDQGDVEGPSRNNKNQSNLFNRSSPMKIVRVCRSMTDDQRAVIREAEFTGLLGMKVSKLMPELCRYLMGSFNPQTCKLDFGDRGKIPITTQSVVRVMGVPGGGNKVPYCLDVNSTGLILEMFGIHNGKQPTVAFVEKLLGPTNPPNQNYLRKFVIYSVSSVFAPNTGTLVSPRCYPSVINANAIRHLNWARFIIDVLIQTATAKDTKNWFKACMPYIMVLYVDSLETDALDIPEDGTRICIWTNKMVRLIVDLDTNGDGSFGTLPLKKCFRIRLSLFSAEPSDVDMFVKRHVPGDHTDEDLAKYREVVIKMCNVFEDGLAKFLTLSNKEHTDFRPEQKKFFAEEVQRVVQQPKRRMRRRRSRPLLVEVSEQIVDDTKSAPTEVELTEQVVVRNNNMQGENGDCAENGGVQKTAPGMETWKDREDEMQTGDGEKETEKEAILECHLHATGSGTPEISKESELSLAEPEHVPTGQHSTLPLDPLKLLQLYGSGSQSSADNLGGAAPLLSPLPAAPPCKQQQPKVSSSKRKKCVSFVDQLKETEKEDESKCMQPNNISAEVKASPVEQLKATALGGSPIGRPITRSMSPLKSLVATSKASPRQKKGLVHEDVTVVSPSPRRSSRFATAEARANCNNQMAITTSSGIVAEGCEVADSTILCDSMNKRLFGSVEGINESEQKMKRLKLIEDCPSFDLDESPCEDFEAAKTEVPVQVEGDHVIACSNDDSGDSLDKIYAIIDMPTRTPVGEDGHKVLEETVSLNAPNSITPIPQAHQRRVVKPGPARKSPFVDVERKAFASKSAIELYNKVCEYTGKDVNDPNEEPIIIDDGRWFINLKDLADSVRPGGKLSNSTCEMALNSMSMEMAQQKKFLMPLRIAGKLRSATCFMDKSVKKAFENSPSNRLDHKEMIMFSVLQDLTPDIEATTGHYYLIVLNLKAERFEVMDSLRREGDKGFQSDYRAIIGSIKNIWSRNYNQSKFNISKYKTLYISTPMQSTNFDCGFFMLKFIECWNGRMMLPFKQSDMPVIRKLLVKKWLDREENKVINWHEVLFQT